MRRMKRFDQYVTDWLNWKRLSRIAAGGLLLSLLPILYLSFFNYATGDDLGYGAALHQVIVNGGSPGDMAAAVIGNVRNSYYSFQGTWSSIALFSMEPSVWGEHFYIVTTWIALFCLIFCQGCLICELLVRRMGLPRDPFLFLYALMVFLQIQYMPFHRSGLFWYTGMAHYVIPYGACMMGLFWMLAFLTAGKKRYLIGCFLMMTYLGGAGYPEVVLAVMGFLLAFSAEILDRIKRKETSGVKKLPWLLLPFCALLIGFAFSAKAPGNRVRGGAGFGFDAGNAVSAIGRSLSAGVTDAIHYLITARPLVLLIPLIVICVWETFPVTERRDGMKHAVATLIACYLVFSAIHAPEQYVGEEVEAGISGGVYNSYFFVFTACLLIGTVSLTGALKAVWCRKHDEKAAAAFARRVRIPGILLLLLFCLFFRSHLIGNATDYVAIDYIRSGQLEDFRQQMKERLEILEDPEIRDAVLEPMNDWQGPLMHFPVGEDPNSFVNHATAEFYGKRSVVVKGAAAVP